MLVRGGPRGASPRSSRGARSSARGSRRRRASSGPRRSAAAVSWSVPGARPMPRSMRPGCSASSIPNCSATVERRVVGQHHAAGAEADGRRDRREVREQHRRRRAGDAGHVVVLGDPVPPVAEALGLLHQRDRVAQRVGGRGTRARPGRGRGRRGGGRRARSVQASPGATASKRVSVPVGVTRRPEHGGAKWVPITSRSVSACSARRRRRVADDCSRSVSGSANQSGSANCTGWCARSPVIERVVAARLDVHRDVPGRVPGRELEPDLVGDAVVGRHEIGEPGVDHRPHRVVDGQPRSRCRPSLVPVLPLVAAQQVAGVRERRAPTRRRPASCSTPRGRSAGACRSRCRPPRAGSRRRRGRRGTASAG